MNRTRIFTSLSTAFIRKPALPPSSPNDRLKLSKWAEEYEKKHGKIRCEQRVENNEKRRQGQFVKDLKSWRKAQFHSNRKLQLRQAFQRQQIEQKNLGAYQTGQRTALSDQQSQRMACALQWKRGEHSIRAPRSSRREPPQMGRYVSPPPPRKGRAEPDAKNRLFAAAVFPETARHGHHRAPCHQGRHARDVRPRQPARGACA